MPCLEAQSPPTPGVVGPDLLFHFSLCCCPGGVVLTHP